MVYSDYVKQRMFYYDLEKSFVQITHCLAEERHVTMKTNRRVTLPHADISSCLQAVCTSMWPNLLMLAQSVGVSLMYIVRA